MKLTEHLRLRKSWVLTLAAGVLLWSTGSRGARDQVVLHQEGPSIIDVLAFLDVHHWKYRVSSKGGENDAEYSDSNNYRASDFCAGLYHSQVLPSGT